jgi:hypothetical protein
MSLKCTAEPAMTSFVLEARDPQRVVGHVAPSSARRRGLELQDTWQHQSPPRQEDGFVAAGHVVALEPSLWGGGVQSCRTCGGTGALLSREEGWSCRTHGGTGVTCGSTW